MPILLWLLILVAPGVVLAEGPRLICVTCSGAGKAPICRQYDKSSKKFNPQSCPSHMPFSGNCPMQGEGWIDGSPTSGCRADDIPLYEAEQHLKQDGSGTNASNAQNSGPLCINRDESGKVSCAVSYNFTNPSFYLGEFEKCPPVIEKMAEQLPLRSDSWLNGPPGHGCAPATLNPVCVKCEAGSTSKPVCGIPEHTEKGKLVKVNRKSEWSAQHCTPEIQMARCGGKAAEFWSNQKDEHSGCRADNYLPWGTIKQWITNMKNAATSARNKCFRDHNTCTRDCSNDVGWWDWFTRSGGCFAECDKNYPCGNAEKIFYDSLDRSERIGVGAYKTSKAAIDDIGSCLTQISNGDPLTKECARAAVTIGLTAVGMTGVRAAIAVTAVGVAGTTYARNSCINSCEEQFPAGADRDRCIKRCNGQFTGTAILISVPWAVKGLSALGTRVIGGQTGAGGTGNSGGGSSSSNPTGGVNLKPPPSSQLPYPPSSATTFPKAPVGSTNPVPTRVPVGTSGGAGGAAPAPSARFPTPTGRPLPQSPAPTGSLPRPTIEGFNVPRPYSPGAPPQAAPTTVPAPATTTPTPTIPAPAPTGTGPLGIPLLVPDIHNTTEPPMRIDLDGDATELPEGWLLSPELPPSRRSSGPNSWNEVAFERLLDFLRLLIERGQYQRWLKEVADWIGKSGLSVRDKEIALIRLVDHFKEVVGNRNHFSGNELDEIFMLNPDGTTWVSSYEEPESDYTKQLKTNRAGLSEWAKKLLEKHDYDVIKMLGQGGQGKTFLVKHRTSGVLKVVKEALSGDQLIFLRNEYAQASKVKGKYFPLVTKLDFPESWNKDPDRGKLNALLLLQDFVAAKPGSQNPAPTMKKRLHDDYFQESEGKDKNGTFQKRRDNIIDQLLEAIQSLHEQGIVHMDLKPENILIDDDGKLYIIDFGAAAPVNLHQLNDPLEFIGTIQYSSPEALSRRLYKSKAKIVPGMDVYSLQRVLEDILSGRYLTNGQPKLPMFEKAITMVLHPRFDSVAALKKWIQKARALKGAPPEAYEAFIKEWGQQFIVSKAYNQNQKDSEGNDVFEKGAWVLLSIPNYFTREEIFRQMDVSTSQLQALLRGVYSIREKVMNNRKLKTPEGYESGRGFSQLITALEAQLGIFGPPAPDANDSIEAVENSNSPPETLDTVGGAPPQGPATPPELGTDANAPILPLPSVSGPPP